MMNIKEHLLNYFPSTIKKDSEVFSSLVASPNKDKGSIEQELETMRKYLENWFTINNVYNLDSDRLDKVVDFISYLTRFTDETDKSLINRISAIFVRNKDTKWGTKINILNVFKQYFPLAKIFVTENTNDIDNNLIENFDFSSLDESWIFENAEISAKARFSKSSGGLLKNETSKIKQNIEIDEKTTYFLHFFSKGKCGVSISSNNLFWNNDLKTWQETSCSYEINNDKWNDNSLYFITNEEMENVLITFNGIDEECFIDYVRLFEKFAYSTFTVIAHFEGSSSVKAMALAKGNADPYIELDEISVSPNGNLIYKDKVLPEGNPLRLDEEGNLYSTDESYYIKNGRLYTTKSDVSSDWYENAFYYDSSYFTGVMSGFAMDIYTDLLKYVKSVGVNAFLEIVSKDYIEGEE